MALTKFISQKMYCFDCLSVFAVLKHYIFLRLNKLLRLIDWMPKPVCLLAINILTSYLFLKPFFRIYDTHLYQWISSIQRNLFRQSSHCIWSPDHPPIQLCLWRLRIGLDILYDWTSFNWIWKCVSLSFGKSSISLFYLFFFLVHLKLNICRLSVSF